MYNAVDKMAEDNIVLEDTDGDGMPDKVTFNGRTAVIVGGIIGAGVLVWLIFGSPGI